MANYEALKTAIRNAVYENGNNEITGQALQDVLKAIVNSLGAGYQFASVATTETEPGTPDSNVMYIAGAGTYPNFGGTVVPRGSLGIFRYNGEWNYTVLDVASWADASNKLYYNTQAGNVAAKTIQANGFTLQPGGWLKVHFDNANTVDNPTLNVNNTGAHIMTFNGRSVSATNSWKAGETVAFYYDNYGVGIWRGIRLVELPDFLNVNDLVGQSTPFASASAARSAIPQQNRKAGLNITYLLTTGENTSQWVQDMFIGDDVSDWGVADNWKTIGPVSVSQNTSTGHTDINVGSTAHPVASVEEVSQLGQKFDFCNVNFQNGVPNTAYADAETARAAVPENFRKYGLVIAYKLADGWHIEQYIFSRSINPWMTSSGCWKTYDYKPEYIVYNLNINNSTTEYTLAEAFAAVPSEYHTIARAIIFRQTGVGTTLALFNADAYISGWTNPDNWLTISSETLAAWNTPVEKLQFDAFLQAYQDKRMNIPTRKIKAPINLPLIYGQIYTGGSIYKRGDGMRYEEIIISPTAKYYYSGTVRASGNAMVWYGDKDDNTLGIEIIGTGSNVSYTEQALTIPNGAVKMRVGSFIVPGYNELQIVVEDYASRFVEQYGTNDLWAKKYIDVPLTLEARKNIQVDGTIITYSSGGCSQLIPVDHSKKYKLETMVDQYCCGVAFYSDAEGTQCVGFQVTSYALKTIAEILDIPSNAVTMRVGTRELSICNLYEVEFVEAATLEGLKELQEEIQHIGTDFVSRDQGSSNYGKVLVVGADGMVVPGTGGGEEPTANSVVLHQSKTLYLSADIIDNPNVNLGTGWSGSLASGFTHTSGNTAIVEIQQATTSGKKYLVECTLSSAAEASIYLSIGDTPLVDVYNGTTTIKIGIISDGGYLKITPASGFSGSVSNISIKEVVSQESAVETLNIQVGNIEDGTMSNNITGFWNVVLGYSNTMQHNENGSRNIVAGYAAMGAFKSGTRNVALGTFAGCNLESGDRNIAIGADAFWYAQKASDNISIGYASMGKMQYSHPSSNIAIGSQAMGQLQEDASENVAVGRLSNNYAGKRNASVGEYANYYTRGNDNVAIGYYANGYPYETGDKNIAIGAFAKCGNSGTAATPETINNAIAIGYNAIATKSNQIVIGNTDHTEIVLLGNKKLVFNNDNTVTWETI